MPASRHLANDAWEALLSAHATLMKQFAAEDIWGEISMREYDVLYTLSKCREPQRLSELNRHVLLSQPALSRLVDRLAGRGLVQRHPDPADRRGIRLSLTQSGRALQRQVGRKHARGVASAMAAGLTPGELRQLEAICLKLADQPDATLVVASHQNGDMLL
jgi:DNA-binding MarR family transcriptional regulator